METLKIIRTTLTLEDPMHMYNADIDASLLDMFNKNWKNKCFSGVYVLSANKILRRSAFKVNNRSLDAHCTVSVEMETSILVYEKEDLIICKVITIYQNGDIVLANNHACAYIDGSQILKSVDIGEEIPLYVVNSTYPPGKSKISVIGVPFVPLYKNDIYLLDPTALTPGASRQELKVKMDDEEKRREKATDKEKELERIGNVVPDFRSLWDTIKIKEDALKVLEKDKTKVFKHFKSLLGTTQTKYTATVKEVPLKNIIGAKGLVSRPTSLYGVSSYLEYKKADDYLVMDENVVVGKLLYAYIKELNTLTTLISHYDEQSIKDLSHVWAIYNKYKR